MACDARLSVWRSYATQNALDIHYGKRGMFDDLVVRVIPNEAFDHRHNQARIEAAYRECFQSQFKVEVELVE